MKSDRLTQFSFSELDNTAKVETLKNAVLPLVEESGYNPDLMTKFLAGRAFQRLPSDAGLVTLSIDTGRALENWDHLYALAAGCYWFAFSDTADPLLQAILGRSYIRSLTREVTEHGLTGVQIPEEKNAVNYYTVDPRKPVWLKQQIPNLAEARNSVLNFSQKSPQANPAELSANYPNRDRFRFISAAISARFLINLLSHR